MLIVVIIYIAVAIIQIPGLVKKKLWKDLVVFSLFYIAAVVLSSLFALGVEIPSPMKGVQYVIEDVFGLKYPE